MMIFMMRGMRGGPGTGAGDQEPRQDELPTRDHIETVRADQRIADLERQVAELRDERHPTEGVPGRRLARGWRPVRTFALRGIFLVILVGHAARD